jgi:Ca2+/Na+ antiporter
MGNIWFKILAWTKVVLFALVVIYLVLFITNNSEEKAKLWFWFQDDAVEPPRTSVLRLVFFSFVAGILVTVLARAIWRTVRQVREMRHRAAVNRLANQPQPAPAETSA